MTLKEKIMANGKRWQKNGMDRFYINFADISEIEVDDRRLDCYFNRYQRGNMKIYYDMVKDTFVVTEGDEEHKKYVEAAIMAM